MELTRQVFISHTGQDELGRIFAANMLRPALEAAGLTTFMDYYSLEPGCAWPTQLVEAAVTSTVFVVVLTESYATRFWCLTELDLALHGHPLYPRGDAEPLIIPVYLQHHSTLQYLSTEQLQHQLASRLAAAQASERQDLQHLSPERMLANVRALKNTQGVRRQHQEPLPAPMQPQQQHQDPLPAPQQHTGQQQHQPAPPPPPALLGVLLGALHKLLRGLTVFERAAATTSSGPRVPAPKDEEWQMACRVAAAALLQLPASQRLAYTPPGLVGYEQQLAELTAQLVVDKPDMLGLWLYGPGGLGKTTMAKLLYNSLRTAEVGGVKQFPKAAMLELDLEGSSVHQLNRHLVQLLEGLGETSTQGSNAELLESLAALVRKHKVLLLVDNINHDAQLDTLLPTAFSSGSRVIITSRMQALPSNKTYEALTSKNAPSLRNHNVATLQLDHARILFRQCHGLGEQQLQRLNLCGLENQLLQACSGLPLALQVIGGALQSDKGTSDANISKRWQEVSSFSHGQWTPTYTASSEARLQDVVYHSFSKLSPAAQNMFLDSISVLQDQPLSKAMLVWEAWWPNDAQQAFRRLQQLSLINIKQAQDHYGLQQDYLGPLDVLRSLGQSILLKPDRADRLGDKYVGSRVWLPIEGGVQCLMKGKQPVAMNLDGYYTVEESDHVLLHADLSNVRILICHDVPPDMFCLAPHLLWVGRPHRGYKYCADLPEQGVAGQTHQSLDRLALLDLGEDSLEFRDCSHAGWVALAFAMAAAPKLPSLRAIDIDTRLLEWCLFEEELQALVSNLSGCRHLEYVRVHNAVDEVWVEMLSSEHRSLTTLCVYECEGFDYMPDLWENLPALQQLHLEKLKIDILPESFVRLTALRDLNLRDCRGLLALPENFGVLTALTKLDLSGCTGLARLPDSFGELTNLQRLCMSRCTGLSALPMSFGGLVSLQRLDLMECSTLSYLPESFSNLTSLTQLALTDNDGGSLPGFLVPTSAQKTDCGSQLVSSVPKPVVLPQPTKKRRVDAGQ